MNWAFILQTHSVVESCRTAVLIYFLLMLSCKSTQDSKEKEQVLSSASRQLFQYWEGVATCPLFPMWKTPTSF